MKQFLAASFLAIGLSGCAVFQQFVGNDPATILRDTEAAFAIAEATYDSICSIHSPPSFCTDPDSVANYEKAKLALEAAFKTADAALAAGTLNADTIKQLIQLAVDDWNVYNRIVNVTEAKASQMAVARQRAIQ